VDHKARRSHDKDEERADRRQIDANRGKKTHAQMLKLNQKKTKKHPNKKKRERERARMTHTRK